MRRLQKPDLVLVFVSISVKWGDWDKVNRAACVPNQFWSRRLWDTHTSYRRCQPYQIRLKLRANRASKTQFYLTWQYRRWWWVLRRSRGDQTVEINSLSSWTWSIFAGSYRLTCTVLFVCEREDWKFEQRSDWAESELVITQPRLAHTEKERDWFIYWFRCELGPTLFEPTNLERETNVRSKET